MVHGRDQRIDLPILGADLAHPRRKIDNINSIIVITDSKWSKSISRRASGPARMFARARGKILLFFPGFISGTRARARALTTAQPRTRNDRSYFLSFPPQVDDAHSAKKIYNPKVCDINSSSVTSD